MIYITIFSSEYGKQELTRDEWHSKDLDEPKFTWLTREEYDQVVQEIENMPLVLRLVDPRKWVREYK